MTTWRLTHCGHRLAVDLRGAIESSLEPTLHERLQRLLLETTLHDPVDAGWTRLQQEGWVQPCSGPLDRRAVALAYARNPLGHVTTVALEITHRCESSCRHCRSAYFPRVEERDPTTLAHAAGRLVPMGLRRFELVGGEVMRFGTGYLQVSRHLQSLAPCRVEVMTSGWWLERTAFEAAGRPYSGEHELLLDLRANGATHVVLSVDGDAETHDSNRDCPGLFNRIARGIERVRRAGLTVRFSLIASPPETKPRHEPALAMLARRAYDLPLGWSDDDCFELLLSDPDNTVSTLVDIGRRYGRERPLFDLADTNPELLVCKGYFRPYTLRVQPDGGLSTCPLLPPGEGHGDIHREDVRALLNRISTWGPYRHHAGRTISAFLPLVDRELLGGPFAHPCTLRTVTTMLARRLGNDPRSVSPARARAANLEVARLLGALDR